jgi:peptidyl-prolyl cis-trans isomerase C
VSERGARRVPGDARALRDTGRGLRRHILVGALDQAEALRSALEAGADFAEVAAEHSNDTGSAAAGGELGCLPPGCDRPAFDDAAFAAELGELVGPVETQFGYHLLIVDERVDAAAAPVRRGARPDRARTPRERAELALRARHRDRRRAHLPRAHPALPDAEQD